MRRPEQDLDRVYIVEWNGEIYLSLAALDILPNQSAIV